MTRVGIYSRTNDTHETGPPKSEQFPVPDLLDRFRCAVYLSTKTAFGVERMAASRYCGRVGGSGVSGYRKALGKIGFRAFFLAAALLVCGCDFLAATPAQTIVFPEAQPGSEWIRVTAPGWDDQTGFSLMLPPGW